MRKRKTGIEISFMKNVNATIQPRNSRKRLTHIARLNAPLISTACKVNVSKQKITKVKLRRGSKEKCLVFIDMCETKQSHIKIKTVAITKYMPLMENHSLII